MGVFATRVIVFSQPLHVPLYVSRQTSLPFYTSNSMGQVFAMDAVLFENLMDS